MHLVLNFSLNGIVIDQDFFCILPHLSNFLKCTNYNEKFNVMSTVLKVTEMRGKNRKNFQVQNRSDQ